MEKDFKEDYIGILDGIRGLMAFWVFLSHITLTCAGRNTPWGSGAIAVDVFMVLSGFLMAYHWEMRRERFPSVKAQTVDFYVRRFFRIAPLYYALLIVAYLGQDYFFHARDYLEAAVPPPWPVPEGFRIRTDSEINPGNVLAHVSFLFGLFPQYSANNAMPDWSIGLEMQFYAVFPLLMLAFSRLGGFFTTILLTACSVATLKFVGLYMAEGLLGNFPQPSLILFKFNIFAAGMCAAFVYLNRKSAKAMPWLVLTGVSLFPTLDTPQVALAVVFILFMLCFDHGRKDVLHRAFANKYARFFGDTSYSLYLVHYMIIYVVLYGLFQQTWFLGFNTVLRLAVAFVCIAVPAYGLSYLLFRFVEVPGIHLGRKLLGFVTPGR